MKGWARVFLSFGRSKRNMRFQQRGPMADNSAAGSLYISWLPTRTKARLR
jgi:hypothetical protein